MPIASIFSPRIPSAAPSNAPTPRITSIDALRGLVMFTMIFVNDLAGDHAPPWMKHYHGKNGMTFVDLVFPAFLFIVGMSIPIAMTSRLAKGEPVWKLVWHVLIRTVALLAIGILMVNSESGPSDKHMGWSRSLWTALMYTSAILACVTLTPPKPWRRRPPETPSPQPPPSRSRRVFLALTLGLRLVGSAGMIWLAFAYRDRRGHRIIRLQPFSIRTEWYGILGLIGWAYLVASLIFLVVRTRRTALLGCTGLLLCLYAADRKGAFDHFWLARYVNIGEALGSHAAIAVAGVLLASILLSPPDALSTIASRARFTLLFSAGFAAAALLLYRQWGISKNEAAPSWCLWSMAITAVLWLGFYFVADVSPAGRILARPLAVAGQNVLLAYLLSEMLSSTLSVVHLDEWYDRLAEANLAHEVGRSAACAILILCLAALLNRLGFRLKL
jgi:predicted acyltransferase